MKKLNEVLLVLIFIMTAVLAAVVGLKIYDAYDTERQLAAEQEEMELAQIFARNREAQDRVQEMEAEFQGLAEDREELRRFIDSIQSGGEARDETAAAGTAHEGGELPAGGDTVDGNAVPDSDMTAEGNGTFENGPTSEDGAASDDHAISENAAISGNGTLSGNGILSDNTISDNDAVSGNDAVSDNTVSDNAVSDNAVSGNDVVSDNSVSENAVEERMTLAQRRLLHTSLEETLSVNEADRECIAENTIDFSELKIACLGDSITAAANLEGEENYQQYSYPARLKELLGAQEVYNLGIGGSSIGRYWADAYVDRYQEIPEDADIIIVMGGTNDGFCVSDQEFGSLDDRAYRTFCGDLDELMRGLRENYPDADIFFVTPLPNILHDYLMSERDYLLPQQNFVDVMLTLADEYDYQVIDLYNSNVLDSHDADIVADYMPDGVHGNHDGYEILAQHFAASLIRYYETAADMVSENDAGTVSEDGSETVSEDGAETVPHHTAAYERR